MPGMGVSIPRNGGQYSPEYPLTLEELIFELIASKK